MVKANERTFQGILLNVIGNLIKDYPEIGFSKVTQEEQVGIGIQSRFSDFKLYSSKDAKKVVSFELKNMAWDATDESLVASAHEKASLNGYEYFVTGTPKQLVAFRTFEAGKPLNERKLKIFNISRIRQIDDVLNPNFEKEIHNTVKNFLIELSHIVHATQPVHWDSIDEYFANKLSNFILEATGAMFGIMLHTISTDKAFQKRIKLYLREQDIFNITIRFDNSDIYNLCQLSNYLLYLKIIFYSYLQREVPKLGLRKLEIPTQKKELNNTLRERFDDVLRHDFEQIFSENVLDEFEFPSEYLPSFKRNIDEIAQLNFKELNADIIGSIYNTLIDNQEQHDRGQHFTNTDEVDIICAFCIDENSRFIFDSGCGAGTFLVRAYSFLKHYNPALSHQKLLESLWGVDIAAFPVFLAMMNLSLLDITCMENYPAIIQKDFSAVKSNSRFKLLNPNPNVRLDVRHLDNKHKSIKIPDFDVCIGNPPYIRQELIHGKDNWNKLIEKEFDISKLNQQSDIYVYYLIHTAAFLKEGGRLGYVIASSWLDVNFGAGLQKFILSHFKIVAVIDNQKMRSFSTASVNTVMLILEKCSNAKSRENSNVRFIRIFKDYKSFIGKSIEDEYRIQKVHDFVRYLTSYEEDSQNDDFCVIFKNQKDLESESTFSGKYYNGHWGAKYLRAPAIYNKMISSGNGRFIKLTTICDVWRGFTTGVNEFFYMKDDSVLLAEMSDERAELMIGKSIPDKNKFFAEYGWYYSDLLKQHFVIERQFLLPLFKTQKEAQNLEVDFSRLKYSVLLVNYSKQKLKIFRYKVLKYILSAEEHYTTPQNRPTCSSRVSTDGKSDWYMLGSNLESGDFIFPTKIGEKYRLIDNRQSKVFADKVNYNITVKEKFKDYSDLIFLYLNSITFRFFIDLFSRQLTGSQTLSDVDVNLVEKTLIVKPELLWERREELMPLYHTLKSREQKSIFEEILDEDRRKLDTIIFDILGLNEQDVDEMYYQIKKYILERASKSGSVVLTKSKSKMEYTDVLELINERFDEVRKFEDLISNTECVEYFIYNSKVKFPNKNYSNTDSIFDSDIYVEFLIDEGNVVRHNFNNINQIKLFEFIIKTFDLKDTQIKIPVSPIEAGEVLNSLKSDYVENFSQISSFLKSHRLRHSDKILYRDLVFGR